MSILQRPGWKNKVLVTEARSSADGLRRRIGAMYDKSSLGNVPFYTISKMINTLRRDHPGKADDAITDDDIKEAMMVVGALSRPPSERANPEATRKAPTMWQPKLNEPGVTPDTVLQQSIDKAKATREQKADNQAKESELFSKNFGMKFNPAELSAAYEDSFTNNVGVEVISKQPFTINDVAAIRDVFDYSGDIEGDPADTVGELPPNTVKGGYVIEFDIPNDSLFISSTLNQSRLVKITNDFRDDIEDAIGREVEVIVHPPTPSKEADAQEPLAHKESVRLSPKQVNQLLRENAMKRKQTAFRYEEIHRY